MKRILTSMLIATSILALTWPSLAGEPVRLKLKDGTIWRGETTNLVQITYAKQGLKRTITGRLTKVDDLYLVVESEFGEIPIFKADLVAIHDAILDEEQTKELDRSADRNARPRHASSGRGVTSRPGMNDSAVINPDAPGVFVLPLSGQVGVEFRHEEIEKFIAEVDEFGDGQIVILKIDSPGGFLAEMPDLSQAIGRLKQNHRVVAWVEQALSAACGVAVMCDEIYFTTEGTAGSATPIVGNAVAPDEIFDAWTEMMGRWMDESGRSRYIVEAMIDMNNSLSYSKDEETGNVHWYHDTSGQYVLSNEGENFTFNSSVALHSGFASGIADTNAELAALLDLDRWSEKSDYGRRLHAQWHKTVDRAKKEIPKIGPRLGYLTNTGDRIRDLTRTIKIQKEALRWWRIAPNVARQSLPAKQTIEQGLENNEHTLMLLRQR